LEGPHLKKRKRKKKVAYEKEKKAPWGDEKITSRSPRAVENVSLTKGRLPEKGTNKRKGVKLRQLKKTDEPGPKK